MGIYTDIEYCDSSVNPTSGCDGCELWTPGKGGSCYAGAIHTRFGNGKNPAYPGAFHEVHLHPGRMAIAAKWSDLRGRQRVEKRNKKGEVVERAKPWLDGLPRVIFISDMSDAMSQAVPFEYLKEEIIDNVNSREGRRHFWLWLTKQPGRMVQFDEWLAQHGIDWPVNLMPGTSLTSARSYGRISQILRGRFMHRWLSIEPMLGPVDPVAGQALPSGHWTDVYQESGIGTEMEGWVGWIVCGGASGRNANPMHPDWPRSIRDQCAAAGVPFFFKQWGDWLCIPHVLQRAGDAIIDGTAKVRSVTYPSMVDAVVRKVGKKHAGRLLDGIEHNAMPLEAIAAAGLDARAREKAVTHG